MTEKRVLLGVFYPETAIMQPISYTLNYDRGECEKEGLVWFEGYCFDLPRKSVREIDMKSEDAGKERRVFTVYAIFQSE